ncbi:MAG: hypothetical protein KIS84_09335 [Dokdonella sp.]|nr:hypothetical protein [Dokdonella sp.]
MAERLMVWRCIGCGRIEGPQPCIGVCEDRKAELVNASDYDDALARLAAARARTQPLIALVRQLAGTTPREGEWESTYRALQARARETLRTLTADGDAHGRPETPCPTKS